MNLSQQILNIGEQLKQQKETCFYDFVSHLQLYGIAFLLLLFSLPAALPIPAIGLNTIIALPLLLLTVQQALGRHSLWVPDFVGRKSINPQAIEGFIQKSIPFIKKIEILSKPRLLFLTSQQAQKIIGLLGFVMALAVAIPLPLTNTVPSFGIAMLAVGVLMRDGFAVIIGALVGIAWVSMLVAVFVFFGVEGAEMVKDFIKGWVL